MPANPSQNVKQLPNLISARAAKDEAFRQELIADPKGVLARELAKLDPDAPSLPADFKVQVIEEERDVVYLRVPKARPAGSRELHDEELAAVAGGGCNWFMSFTDCCTVNLP